MSFHYRLRIAHPDPARSFRHRRVPDRIIGDKVVAAHPAADEAVVLSGAAAAVWLELDDWTTDTEIGAALARAHPAVADSERRGGLEAALRMLTDEGLLERQGD